MALKINLTEERLQALDPGNMLGMTLELPAQIQTGLQLGRDFCAQHALEKIATLEWVGLGGSAVVGDLLQGFGFVPPHLPLRIAVQRYPQPVQSKRLVCSYSGNTAESVRAFEATPPQQIWFSASSGGRLQELAQKAGVPHLSIPGGYPPRAAVGFLIGAMLAIFERVYQVKNAEASDLWNDLAADASRYRVLDLSVNPALALAAQWIDRTPVIYTVDGDIMPPLAFRLRAQFAENSKVWSHSSDLPEQAHNEVETFDFLSQLLPPPAVLYLGDWKLTQFPDPREGQEALLDSLRVQHSRFEPTVIWGRPQSALATGLRSMLRLDAATVYLGILRAVNPLEIPVITKLKNSASGLKS